MRVLPSLAGKKHYWGVITGRNVLLIRLSVDLCRCLIYVSFRLICYVVGIVVKFRTAPDYSGRKPFIWLNGLFFGVQRRPT